MKLKGTDMNHILKIINVVINAINVADVINNFWKYKYIYYIYFSSSGGWVIKLSVSSVIYYNNKKYNIYKTVYDKIKCNAMKCKASRSRLNSLIAPSRPVYLIRRAMFSQSQVIAEF